MRELAIAIQNKNEDVNIKETIYAIQKVGFKNVFVQWYDADWQVRQEEQVRI